MKTGIPEIVELLTDLAIDDEKRGVSDHGVRGGRQLAKILSDCGIKPTPTHERDYVRIYNSVRFLAR